MKKPPAWRTLQKRNTNRTQRKQGDPGLGKPQNTKDTNNNYVNRNRPKNDYISEKAKKKYSQKGTKHKIC